MKRSLLLSLLWLALWRGATACPDPEAVIVYAHATEPYTQAAKALTEAFVERHVPVRSIPLSRLPEKPPCPRLWAAVGSQAVHSIRQRDPQTPLVAVLVLDQEIITAAAPATGVTLIHPLAVQWHWFRKLLPRTRSLGVLYSPDREDQLQQLIKLGIRDNVQVSPFLLSDPADLPSTLHHLPNRLEVLWLLGNGRLFSATTARSILLAAYRRRIALIGLSRQWVKAGAAYALDWDYSDLGKQAAELALQIWYPPHTLPPPVPPRRLRVIINRRVFEHLGLSVPVLSTDNTVIVP